MNEFMKEAIDLSKENFKERSGGPFGACIVKDGKIIGKGKNSVIKNNDPTAHAEVMAIRDACRNINSYDLSNCELYTSCFPCPMCLSAIIWSNIKTVYYGNTKEDAADIGFRDNFIYDYLNNLANNKEDNSVMTLKTLNHDEALEAFKEYQQDPNKITY